MFESLEQRRARRRRRLFTALGVSLTVLAGAAIYEFTASPLQAVLISDYAKRLTFASGPGPSPQIHFPEAGPYDIRLGYARLPEFSRRLADAGYAIAAQARISDEMAALAHYGLFLPYREKSVAGLHLRDCAGDTLYHTPNPALSYARFDDIPPLVANTLLFIENRELLDPNHPRRNPAVEWDRLAQAVLEKGMQVVDPDRNVPGGSTLATQIEKYRHSPDGLTLTPSDKLIQMASASVRAYLEGADTRVTRQRIVLDYLNTVPLAAAPGHGEVLGLGDALKAWFGLDFDQVNAVLQKPGQSSEAARAYKHVLALLIAQRKPSYYLLTGRQELNQLANVHLRLLADAGVISGPFRDLALLEDVAFVDPRARTPGAPQAGTARFIDNKAGNALRVELSRLLGVERLYDLDRLDLSADTTLNLRAQRQVTDLLRQLKDPVAVEALGLFGPYLLSPGNDLAKPIYSFTLYELDQGAARLRIQADNLNQPFDINRGAKLDMGSSAKLRTLITYLGLIAELHGRYAWMPREQLAQAKASPRDPLSQWSLQHLRTARDRSLGAMLQAAMARQYSASPAENFFTGGGLHSFSNFNRDDDTKVMDLWEATRNSVNLPFIRLMRDIVQHLIYREPGSAAQVLSDPDSPERQAYLTRFADKEGKAFLARFHRKYKDLPGGQVTAHLLDQLSVSPKRLAAVLRYIEPNADLTAFKAQMRTRLANPGAWSDSALAELHTAYGPERFDLNDRAYIAQIHPLELWLVAYLHRQPKASWSDIVAASAKQRIEVYRWLFSAAGKNAQDNRILSQLEMEAFQEIHHRWRQLGYPFSSLVSSYASAIGSSADRPAALAELMGVILNDGVRLQPTAITRLEFAADTPYHTVFQHTPAPGEQVIPAAVAQVVRQALAQVVEDGTARRLRGSFTHADGRPIVLGGKTGTGDHRFETYGSDGKVLESKVMNRVATFAFYLGRRFYGVVTVLVPGEAAAGFSFTSSLPTQILKLLEPALRPMVVSAEARHEPSWEEAVAEFEAANPPPPKPAPPAPAVPTPAAPPTGTTPRPAAPPATTLPSNTPTSPPAPPSPPAVPATPPATATEAPTPPAKPAPKPASPWAPEGNGFGF